MDAITICAANYLPFVEVLGNSFLDSNLKSTFTVLVIDAEKVSFAKNENFLYISPSDLDIEKDILSNMAFYYNVTELATALKPSALKYLFNQGSQKVVYLDPDIEVFGELIELDQELETNAIVLTPHTLTPMPRDGLRPSEADIMSSGSFNLGFLGLSKSPDSLEMLDWWEERLRFDSISDPAEMLFTDQRWIDLLPSYFKFQILRHPGYNVAYWNLQERILSLREDKFFVNDQELKFFHFSGYRPDKPWILSKYVSDSPRIVISKDNTLGVLCERYGSKANQAGWENESSIPYGYQNFESGKFIPSSLRRLYREDCIRAYKNNEVLRPPNNWQTWASERSIESGNLSRILFSIWKSRPDLKRRFPDATGTEAKDLLAWAMNHGISEKVIDEDFLQIGSLKFDVIPTKFSKKKGINVAGYLTGELGLGQSARLILDAAISSGLPVTTINSNRTTSRQQEKLKKVENDYIFPVTVAVVNADHFKLWADDFGLANLKRTYVIGVWAWETEDFPVHMHSAFEYVDEIWAVSTFVRDAISKHTNKPIFVLPTPITKPEIVAKLDRGAIGLSKEAKYNLFIFDYSSVFNRKNPLGLVEAHLKAFPDQNGPLLVIKSTNGSNDAENREKLRFSIRNRTDILLIEDYLSREQLTALINESECYISLHRSEGYGLTMAEAMSLGKPVIATEYSGNLDFMNSSNSILIPSTKIPIGDGSFPYDKNSYWGDPDLNIAASKLKMIWEHNAFAQKIGQSASISSQISYPKSKTLDFISKRIKKRFALLVYFEVPLRRKFMSFKKSFRIVGKLIKNPKRILGI